MENTTDIVSEYNQNFINAFPLIEELAKNSDVFCPVMEEIHPLSRKEHVQMCLATLVSFGYKITK